jgi:hypothetical protein
MYVGKEVRKQRGAMASASPNTAFLVFIVILVIVIIILLGICWKFLRPEIMRKLMRPGSSAASGDRSIMNARCTFLD